MSRANIVTIEHLEVKKTAIEKIKRFFKIEDDSEAVNMALDVASGKIELENIFEKHKGVKIKKVYA